jgi:hypothetical protein
MVSAITPQLRDDEVSRSLLSIVLTKPINSEKFVNVA